MAAPPKRCYYEVLGLPRDCTPDDIKQAFRRQALALHPDKQPPGSDVAAATAAFQELQHAHSVLSDPSERAYYDSHRSQILFASSSTISGGTAAFAGGVDLFAYFSSSAFSGFADSGRGFYKVYGDVFSKVYAQELAYARRLGVSASSVPPPPLIGNLDSPYTQVLAFYNYWLGFSTIMDFAWAGEWDAAAGPSRRARRLMEEENKKASKKARREYNDAVRGLAAFAKKRDKRVVDMVLKKKAEEQKRRNEEKERKKEEERKKKERAMAYVEPEWARVDEEDDYEVLDEEEDKGKKKQELYCIACNKKFKSDKQWKNHEQSKKHRDKIAELRMAFKEEEETLKEDEAAPGVGGDGENVDVGFDFRPAQESDESDWADASEDLSEEFREGLGLRDEGDGDKDLDEGHQEVGSYDEASVLEAMLSSRKNRKSDHASQQEASLSDDDEEQSSQMHNTGKKGRRRQASKRGGDEDVNPDAGRAEEGGSHPDKNELPNQGQDADDKMEGPSSLNDEAAAQSKGDEHGGNSQNLKKNKKDKKEAGKKGVASEQKNPSKGKKQKDIQKAQSNDCETCGQSFDSRNKLFAHLGDTGHAMIKTRQKNR